MKNVLLFCIMLLCGTYLQAQTETAQQKIEQLLGTWSFVALSDGTDSLVIGSPEIPFAEQLFLASQEANDVGEDSINAKILTDGQVGNDGKALVYYGSDFGSTGWKMDFPDEEPPRLFVVNDTMLTINDGAGFNFYFMRVVSTCADLPTPTISGDLILCFNETSILSVADTYSSYQWYKRPYLPSGSTPQPISGATSASYTVNGNTDALYYFSVVVTQDTCELTSNEVLVDQIIGLLPYAESAGSFTIDANGNTILCNNDTLLLIMHSLSNPQWYKNGVAMPNETNDTLKVTTAGSYTAFGTDFCGVPTSLGVEIPVMEANTPVPIIEGYGSFFSGASVVVTNPEYYQHFEWYAGADSAGFHPIIGVDTILITYEDCSNCGLGSGGAYEVRGIDQYGCSESSGIIAIEWLGIEEVYGGKIRVYPNPATNFVQIENSGSQQIKALNVIDSMGRVVLSEAPNSHSPTLLVQNLSVGVYYCQIVLQDGILYRPFAKF